VLQGAYPPRRVYISEVLLLTYAIIETGGKQYRVQAGETVRIEKLDGAQGDAVVLDKVLAVSKDGKLTTGAPYVEGAKVTGTVRLQGRAPKIIVFKYHNKTQYRRKTGHRQPYTAVTITGIEA
jgi:large subunit ribosomal protein L21